MDLPPLAHSEAFASDELSRRHLEANYAVTEKRNQELLGQNQELLSTIARLTSTIEKLEQRVSELAAQLGHGSNQNVVNQASTVPTENPNKKRKTIAKKSSSTQKPNEANPFANAKLHDDERITESNDPVNSQNLATPLERTTSAGSSLTLSDEHPYNEIENECDIDNIGWKLVTNKHRGANQVTPIQIEPLDNDKKAEIIAGLNEAAGFGNYKWMQKRFSTSPKLFCNNNDTKNKIKNWLTRHGVQFNTFADETNRLKAFIVRGICCGTDDENIESIKTELAAHGVQSGYEVGRFITGRQKHAEHEINILYKIIVPHQFDESVLRQIRTIGVFGVKIEKMQRTNVVQCRKCQRFAHTANQCFYAYRCVKCSETHLPGNCPRNNNTSIPVSCINCNENCLQHIGHSANQYASCAFYKQKFSTDHKKTTATRTIQTNQTHRQQQPVPTINIPTTRGNATTSSSHRPPASAGPRTTHSNGANNIAYSTPTTTTWAQVAKGNSADDKKLQMLTSIFRDLMPRLIQIGECLQS